MYLFGVMSTARESSLTSRISPLSVFRMRWMVIAPTSRAIASTAVQTSGL